MSQKAPKTLNSQPPYFSLIIPVKDEEMSLLALYERTATICRGRLANCEIIFVNDGSVDQSSKVISKLHERDARVKGVELRRNFGQTAAIAAGLDMAKGDILITIDADLQNDPADIPLLLEKISEGYDIVAGWRKDRKDSLIARIIPSLVGNFLISKISGVNLHDYGCTLKAYRREALEGVRLYGDMHRFLPIFSNIQGARITEVVVKHYPRQFGRSKYGPGKIFTLILDLITIRFFLQFLTKPIRFFGSVGIVLGVLGFFLAAYLTFLKIVYGTSIGDRPLLLLSIFLMLVGIQFIGLGILGEVSSRTYFESQNKSTYTIRRVIQ